MRQIQLLVLGGATAADGDGAVLAGLAGQRKLLALLTWAAVEGRCRFLDVDAACATFWPDADTTRARKALNQTLYISRRLLAVDVWQRSPSGAFRVAPGAVACDVVHLLHGDPDAAWVLRNCVGEVLPGLRLPDCPAFDDWLDRLRNVARRRAATILAGAGGEVDRALHCARRALELDPWCEAAAVRVVSLLGVGGRRAEAWQFYTEYRRRLCDELDLDPPAELTRAVVRVCGPEPVTPLTEAPAPASVPAMGTGDIVARTHGVAVLPRRGAPPLVLAAGAVLVTLAGMWWFAPGIASGAGNTFAADVVLAGGTSAQGRAWDAAVAPLLASRLADGGVRILRVTGRDPPARGAPFVVRGAILGEGAASGVVVELEDVRTGRRAGIWRLSADAAFQRTLAAVTDSMLTIMRRNDAAHGLRETGRRREAVDALLAARRELDAAHDAFGAGAMDVMALRLARAESLIGAALNLDRRWPQAYLLRAQLHELLSVQATIGGDVAAARSDALAAVAAAADATRHGAGTAGNVLRARLLYLAWVTGVDSVSGEDVGRAAIRHLEAARRDGGGDAVVWVTLGALYSAHGRHSDAYVAAREALGMDVFGGHRSQILSNLFTAAFNSGRDDDARRWCDEIMRRSPRRAVSAECAMSLLLMHDGISRDSISRHVIDIRDEPDPYRRTASGRLEFIRAAIFAAHGYSEDALVVLAETAAMPGLGAGEAAYAVARVHARLGDTALTRIALAEYVNSGGRSRRGAVWSRWFEPAHRELGSASAFADGVFTTPGSTTRY